MNNLSTQSKFSPPNLSLSIQWLDNIARNTTERALFWSRLEDKWLTKVAPESLNIAPQAAKDAWITNG